MIDKTEPTSTRVESPVSEDEELSFYQPTTEELQSCLKYAYQQASVCVPVELIPFAESGKIKTYCCGEPLVKAYKDDCTGKCNFIIKQCVCIEIPVAFGADAFLGEPHIQCGASSDKDNCTDSEHTNEDICTDCNPNNKDICKDSNFSSSAPGKIYHNRILF